MEIFVDNANNFGNYFSAFDNTNYGTYSDFFLYKQSVIMGCAVLYCSPSKLNSIEFKNRGNSACSASFIALSK